MSITIAVRSAQFGDTQLASDHFNTNISYASFTIDSSLGNLAAAVANADDLSALSSSLTADLDALAVTLGAGVDGADFSFGTITQVSSAQAPSNGSYNDWTEVIEAIDNALFNAETLIGNTQLTTTAQTLTGAIEELQSEIDSNDSDITSLQVALATETNNRQLADAALGVQITDLRTDVDTALGTTVPTWGHAGTNYLDAQTSVKDALEALDGELNQVQQELDATQSSVLGANTIAYAPQSSFYTSGTASLSQSVDLLDAALNSIETALNLEDVALNTRIDDLQAEVDATQIGAGLGTDGSYTADTNANFTAGAGSLFNADQLLDSAVKTNKDDLAAEVVRAMGAEAILQANIDAEAVARATADTGIIAELDATQTSLGFGGADSSTYTSGGSAHATTNNVTTDIAALDAGIIANTNSILALGSAFQYVGTINVSTASQVEANPTLLSSLLQPNDTTAIGDYYRLESTQTVPVFIEDASGDTYAVVDGDALVFNAQNGIDRFDNSDPSIAQGSNITVTKTGKDIYEIAVSALFSGRVSTNETNIASLQTWTGEGTALNGNFVATDLAAAVNELMIEKIANDNDINTLNALLTQEIADRIAADANLQGQIDANDIDISNLQAALTQEITDRQTEDQNLQNAINAEATARATADIGLQAQITDNDTDIAGLDTELNDTQASVGVNANGTLPAYANTNNFLTGDTHHVAIGKLDAALAVSQTVDTGRLTVAPMTHQYAAYDRLSDVADLQSYSSSKHTAAAGNGYNGHSVGTADIMDFEVSEELVVLGALVASAPTKVHSDNQSHLANMGYWYNVAVFKNGIRLFQRQSASATLSSSDEYQIKTNEYPATYPVTWDSDLRYAILIPNKIESTYRKTATGLNWGDDDPDAGQPHPLAGMKNMDDRNQPVHASLSGNHPQAGEVRYWVVRFGAALDPQDIITVDYMGLR